MRRVSYQATTQATPSPSPTPPRRPSDRHQLMRKLLQDLLDVPNRVAGGMCCQLLWGSRHHDLAALIASIRTMIHDPPAQRITSRL